MPSVTIGTLDGGPLAVAVISNSAGGDFAIGTAATGKIMRVYKIFFVVTGATTITFKDAASGTAISGAMDLGALGAFVLDNDGSPWFTSAASGAVTINSSAATKVAGAAYYTQLLI